jgi:hypothetical protein
MLRVLRQWSGVAALVLVLAGGTAYAANEWTGANIVNESLTGVDLRDDTVRGADVVESSLGKVGDADTLDRLDSNRFVRGGAAVPGAFGGSDAKAYFNRVSTPAGGGTSTFLEIPGLLHLELDCGPSSSTVRIVSDRNGLELYADLNSQSFIQREVQNTGDSFGFSTTPSEDIRSFHLQAGTGANTFGLQRMLDATVTFRFGVGTCAAVVSALAQRT